MTPLRVLHVVPHLDRIGGYERQAITLARQQRRRHSAEPIVLTHGEPGLPLLSRGLEGEVHRLRKGVMRYHPRSWWRRHGRRVQIVHAHALHKLSGQILGLAHEAGLPSVVKVATEDDVAMFSDPSGWEHLLDGDESAPKGLRWRFMMRSAWCRLRRAGSFVALSDNIARQLSEQGLPCVRLPNGVDTEAFRPPSPGERLAAREALGLPPDTCCITYVGRLAARKCVDDLVDAFARLVQRDAVRAHLLITGDAGEERCQLKRRAAELGCGSRVSFVGLLDDVHEALHASDITVNPSRREGMPNAVLEAWSCGLASVLSDIPAHRHMLGEGERPAALLYPAGDAMALAARLAGLLDAPARRADLGDSARAIVLEHHRIERIEHAYQELYRNMGAAPSGTADSVD